MSYPEPRYLGESGETSASFRPADQPPELVYPSGTRVHYLATGKITRGRFGLYRWELAAESGGPGPHFHRTMTESFYVLSGQIRLYDGRHWVDAGPTDFMHVPEGGIHGFRNESSEPASLLIHFAPGAPREGYFEGNARFLREGRPSEAEMDDFYRQHDNYWLAEA